MEHLNRVLVFAAYVVVGCVIGISAWAAGMFYAATNQAVFSGVLDDIQQDATLGLAQSASTAPVPGLHVEHLFAQRAQIERLQAALAQKDALLDRKTRLLDQKTAEQLALQQELESVMGMLEMLAADAILSQQTDDQADDQRLTAELERLRDERNKHLQWAQRLQSELEDLAAEMAANDGKIQQLQQQSELEATVLLAEMQTFKTVASQALAGLGAESVEALVQLLSDPRPRIRRWAAQVLGQVGPQAQEAIPALIDAMSDEDEGVRTQVRQALDLIQPMEGS
jgi:hypothetical protein